MGKRLILSYKTMTILHDLDDLMAGWALWEYADHFRPFGFKVDWSQKEPTYYPIW